MVVSIVVNIPVIILLLTHIVYAQKMSYTKRWCFTINFKDEDEEFHEISNIFGTASDGPQLVNWNDIQYCICQRERGENGTLHLQGYLILKNRKKCSWLKRHFSERAHFEAARAADAANIKYCSKEDTFEPFSENDKIGYDSDGRWERGERPQQKSTDTKEAREEAINELEQVKVGYKRPAEISARTLMQSGFIPAYKELTAEILGPNRPELKIITLVGPPGTGKSYAIQHFFPEHGRCIYGNTGCWFQNPCAPVMIFEEFSGQIQLYKMLQLLDHYPQALEVKGGMRPAMYETVIITSNVSPKYWYINKMNDQDYDGYERRQNAIHALWDRIGYSDGSYVPVRRTGTYLEAPSLAYTLNLHVEEYVTQCRQFFWNGIAKTIGYEPIEDESEPEPEHEELDDMPELVDDVHIPSSP